MAENQVLPPKPAPELLVDSTQREKRGRRWLLWSFIFCPCHLPVSMVVLASIFGGTAIGSVISRNTIRVGVAFGVVYAIGVGIGFRHLRAAAAGKDCAAGDCDI